MTIVNCLFTIILFFINISFLIFSFFCSHIFSSLNVVKQHYFWKNACKWQHITWYTIGKASMLPLLLIIKLFWLKSNFCFGFWSCKIQCINWVNPYQNVSRAHILCYSHVGEFYNRDWNFWNLHCFAVLFKYCHLKRLWGEKTMMI